MLTLHDILLPSKWRRPALPLAALLLVCACATSGPERPKQRAERHASGFTITEDVRVGLGVRSRFQKALDRLEEEQYEAGIALLVDVIEDAPDVTAAHIDLGIAYARVGDLEKAEASLERALELNPRHPVAHNELGIVYRRSGRFEEARKSYERALDLFPEFHFARRNLAILCDVYLLDTRCAMRHYELYTRAVPGDEAAAMWITDLRNRAGK